MPKNPKHIIEIQSQRLKNKQKVGKFAPGKVTLQVLGTGAKGAPRSLYVFSDQSRYMFNCGEGTQRLAHELKLKLSKLEHIFITQPVWQNLGGLPGITLTMQEVGVPSVNLHGPPGLQELFEAAKKFVVLKNLKLSIATSNPKEVYEDNVMKVQYVALNRNLEVIPEDFPEDECQGSTTNSTNESSKMNVYLKADECISTTAKNKRSRSINSYLSEDSSNTSGKKKKRRKSKKNRSRSLSLASSINSSTSGRNNSKDTFCVTKDRGTVMCYICHLQSRQGALCLDKCVSYGVPPGPLLGKLKSGENIVLENGVMVRSIDVCEPDDPGPVFIVVDCPTEEYITALINSGEFKNHQKFAAQDTDVASVVVHFTPKRVMENPRYKSWMDLFVPSTQHVVLNETNNCMGSMSVHRIQYKLNLIHPEIFPLLGDKGTEVVEEENVNSNGNVLHGSNKIYANTLSAIHLRPKKGLDRSEEVKLNPKEYIEETLSIEGLESALAELKSKLLIQNTETISEYPKILFLGTGSCIPNKTRNTSGILLETGPNQKILVDCGEGTYGQIVRFFGKPKCDEILADLNAIYVSHLHADHHIGVIGVLQGRRRALKNLNRKHEPVILLAPLQLFPWLSFYDKFFERIKDEFNFISNFDLSHKGRRLDDLAYTRMKETLNMKSIQTCLVKHCPNAFGVSFILDDGSKITYSGDTMPCEELILLGMESDLLIHEATMEDDLEHEAVIKMHSTTTQAIEIGKRMAAKYILLTHFSQRYAKLPRFNENFAENVGIAFDNMHVRLNDLVLLPQFNSSLKLMFAEHYDEMELKAMKRQLRYEKENELNGEKLKMQKIQ